MAFQKLERSSQTPPGWRLATVEEARENLDSISRDNLVEEWDRVRLLDGWMGGQAYGYSYEYGGCGYGWGWGCGHGLNVQEGFRSCLGYMLVTERPIPQISDADDRNASIYSEVPELSEEGRRGAFLLSCEDWNEEVLKWLVPGEDRAIREDEEIKAATEVVSAIARKWQGVHADSRRYGRHFFGEVFQESLKVLIVDTEKCFGGLMIKNQNSDQGKFIKEIIGEVHKELIRESEVTENFEMFQDIGPNVAEKFWYDIVELIAWQTFYILCARLYDRVVMHSDPSLTDLIHHAYAFFGKTEKEVTAAAKEANGDFKRFDEILRFPMFRCKGRPDVLSACLLRAAQEGNVHLIKRLTERGVQTCATDDDNEFTALHYAAILWDESEGLEIAEMLLTEDGSLPNAVDYQERTPLHLAASSGKDRMCTLLLDYEASSTAQDKYGSTPLHCALDDDRSNEEVVRVLLWKARGKDGIEGSARLVDIKDNSGETPLDRAISKGDESMVTWLLSLSSQPEPYFKKLQDRLSAYLRESSRMGYVDLVQKLVDGGADPFDQDDEGKTAIHYAAEGENEHLALEIFESLLFDKKEKNINLRKASVGDKYGRNVLHVAAFLGRGWLCGKLLEGNINLKDGKDRDGQSAIYYAVAGPHDNPEVLEVFISGEQAVHQVLVKDFSQTTLLHVAAARGNLNMVGKLLSLISEQESKKDYVEAPDVLGQTALHKAASGGHVEVVDKLLESGAHPLKERDCDGQTALHFAAEADGEDAKKIAKLLLDNCKSAKQKSLLLFASAVGIGLRSNSSLEEYLEEEESKIEETLGPENLLRVAAASGDIDMTLEYVTRGANISLLRNEQWIATLSPEEKNNVQDVMKQVKTIVDQGTDKPAMDDNLGRSPFAIGLAALFLNPFVKSPITVGISGEWGMGKSSVMLQTESNLLKAAAQLAFKSSFHNNKLVGAGKSKLSVTGQAKRRKIANAIGKFDAKVSKKSLEKSKKMEEERKKQATHQAVLQKPSEVTYPWNFPWLRKFWKDLQVLWRKSTPSTSKNLSMFNDFLENYQPKHHQIFKCLAFTNRSDMFEEEEESGSGNEADNEIPWDEDLLQGITPSILTVRYNAWHYRNETEAWAGLAVEITKELEATMTVAHKLRTSWIYNWRNRKTNICFGVIFPFFLAVVVAMFISIIVWLVLGTTHNKDIKKLKYGGLPASMIVAAWGLGKSVISFVKPVSSQVVDYICLPDHSQKLGYHQKVIDDINFLKENLYYKCSLKWEVFAFIWCCITWSWDENNIPRTKIPKMLPAYGNNLRMIVFVDDLDRCEENVILQVLSAVNLVLATCEINVILSMENSMIQRAILRKYRNKNIKDNKSSEELAEKYLRKIVQLPLYLPDPSDSESIEFLKRQLGMWDSIEGPTNPTKETTAHARSKVNPKFQFVTSTLEKFKQGECMWDSIEGSTNPTAETEKYTNAHSKENQKFKFVTSTQEKFEQGDMWDSIEGDSIEGSTNATTETEKYTTHEHSKANPKFQFVTSPLEKSKQERRDKHLANVLAKVRQREHVDSDTDTDTDTTHQGLGQVEEREQEIIEEADTDTAQQGLGKVEEKKIIEESDTDTNMAQQGLGQVEEQEITEELECSGVEEESTVIDMANNNEHPQDAECSGVEEAATVIDMTTGIEEPIKTEEQHDIIEKPERVSPITQIYRNIQKCLCNIPKHNLQSGVEEATTEIHEITDSELSIRTDEEGDQQQREGSKGKRSLMDDLSSIISAMLIPKYTPGERSAFRFLHSRCTRSRKLPRDWKCFMAYHRLAWNIWYLIFHQEDVKRVEGWQVQLIAWIFVCWEWRDLITILIKKWNKLEVLKNWKAEEGPSLREIVEHYIDEKWPTEIGKLNEGVAHNSSSSIEEVGKTSDNLPGENMTTIFSEDSKGDDYLKEVLRKVLREQEELREILRKSLKEQEEMREALRRNLKEQEEMREMFKKKFSKEEEEKTQTRIIKKFFIEDEDMEGESSVQQYTAAEEREEWIKLRDSLRRYNVSMDGIQAFQKFRFYCQPGHLPWPLPDLA